jgi:hypothetical protein
VSKLFWLLFSVPRLLLGWIARVENPSIAVTLKSVIDENIEYFDTHRDSIVPDFGKLPLLRILSYSALSRQ